MNEIRKAWTGQEKLWKVFWLYNFLLGIALNYLLDLVPVENLFLFVPFLGIYLVSLSGMVETPRL